MSTLVGNSYVQPSSNDPGSVGFGYFWAQTDTGLLYIRNTSNSAWTLVGNTGLTSLGDVSIQPGPQYPWTSGLVTTAQINSVLAPTFTVTPYSATANQTVFTGVPTYTPGANTLSVYQNGSRLVLTLDYLETSSTSFTLVNGAQAGDSVVATTGQNLNGVTPAQNISYTLNAVGAVAETVQTKLQQTVSVLDFGADPTGATNSDTAFANAIAGVGTFGILNIGPGTFRFASPIDLRGKIIILQGAGINNTTLKSNAAMANLFLVWEATDSLPTPGSFCIRDLSMDGNSQQCGIGVVLQFRHACKFQNVYFNGFQYDYVAANSWGNNFDNCIFNGSSLAGIWLMGSNHRNLFTSCTFENGLLNQILIQKTGGTVTTSLGAMTPTTDGHNTAVVFQNCDCEYSSAGNGMDVNADSVTVYGGYWGEGIPGNIFTVRGTTVLNVHGGNAYWGMNATNYLVNAVGGKTTFRDVQINGMPTYGLVNVLATGSGGKVKFVNSPIFWATATPGGMAGDVLDYDAQGTVFAPRTGAAYTTQWGGTPPTAGTSNPGYCTITAVSGTTMMGFFASLINQLQWMVGQQGAFVCTYSSNCPVNVYLSHTSDMGAPSALMFTLPSTGGTVQTYVGSNFTLSSQTYTVLEFIRSAPSIGDTFTIQEVGLVDSRVINPGSANLGNLYKF